MALIGNGWILLLTLQHQLHHQQQQRQQQQQQQHERPKHFRRFEKALVGSHSHSSTLQVTISSTFFAQVFCTNVFSAALL
jgi:hypothetical protein